MSVIDIAAPGGSQAALQSALNNLRPQPFFGTTVWSRPALATFSSWLNQVDSGGNAPLTATSTDNAGGLPLVVTAGTDFGTPHGYFPTCLLKTAPATPFTLTIGMAGYSLVSGATYLPIALYDSGGDKLSAIGWTNGGAIVWRYTAASVRATVNGSTVGSGATVFNDYFSWFRVTNDGANTTYYTSPDGILFKGFYTEASGAFLGTIAKVGFGVDRGQPNSASGFVDKDQSAILWNWVET